MSGGWGGCGEAGKRRILITRKWKEGSEKRLGERGRDKVTD